MFHHYHIACLMCELSVDSWCGLVCTASLMLHICNSYNLKLCLTILPCLRMAALHWSSSIICLLPWSNHMICGMLCYHFMAYTYCNLLHLLCTNNACVEYHPFKVLRIFPQWLLYIKLQYYNALLCKDHSRRFVCSGSYFIIDIGLLTTQYFYWYPPWLQHDNWILSICC